jgi:hypothetical protein
MSGIATEDMNPCVAAQHWHQRPGGLRPLEGFLPEN